MANNPNLPKFTSEQARAAGRKSKRPSFDKKLAELIEKLSKKKTGKITRLELMVEVAYKEWLKGNPKLIQYISDRAFGKAHQSIGVTGDEDAPLTIQVMRKMSDAELEKLAGYHDGKRNSKKNTSTKRTSKKKS